MPKRLVPLALCAALASCAQLPDDRGSKSDSYGLLPKLPQFLAKQSTFSPWHYQSLNLCKIQGTELDDFTLPVKVDLWDRIRNGFQLDPSLNQRVQNEIEWYSQRPQYLAQVSERAEKYLFHIVSEIEKRQLPMELALLPIVESAFDPFAYSPGHASGMWQVIPGTGEMLGLKQNSWYDGRRDVIASTDAALNYLEQLYSQVGEDWLLTLAAYNSGAGNVLKAQRKNKAKGKPTDYWSLPLPKETRLYVPRLLALRALVERPDEYGLSIYPVANEPYFVSVDVGSQIDLAQAAAWAEIPMADFSALNPGFNRGATDPEGPHYLLFPRDKAGLFLEKMASAPEEDRVIWHRHVVKPGETLTSIAAQNRTTIELLRSINNLSGTILRAGTTLMVPKSFTPTDNYSHSAPSKQNSGQPEKIEYRVSAGDTLWAIGQRHKVSTMQLAKWNNMSPSDPIRAGQKLVIRPDAKAHAEPTNGVIRKVAYKVRRGDSLTAIANKFNLRVADIMQWNRVSQHNNLRPGEALTLFVDVTQVAEGSQVR